jgi:hypothetical protein
LHVARTDCAAVPDAVTVFHSPSENVCDRFDATMRMPGKACEVIFWDVVAEVVEKEERIEVLRVPESKGAT